MMVLGASACGKDSTSKDNTERVCLNEEYGADVICASDLDGNILGKYAIEDIKDIVAQNGSTYEPSSFLLEKDGILLYVCYGDRTAVYAVDPKNRKIAELYSFDDQVYVDAFDFYKEKFYLALINGDYGSKRAIEAFTFEYEPDTFTFSSPTEISFSVFYDALSKSEWHVNRGQNERECYERVLDETGFVIREEDDIYVHIFKYGNVDYVSAVYNCPYCGTPLEKLYAEYFILSKDYSENADKINSILKQQKVYTAENFGSNYEEVSEDDCEYHKQYPREYCETNEYKVSEINIIDERYLTVFVSGYWYGGAHGYPSRDEYLFDLKSGDQLWLSDFYIGSEDDFRKLIAGKVKEDYERYENESGIYSPYLPK